MTMIASLWVLLAIGIAAAEGGQVDVSPSAATTQTSDKPATGRRDVGGGERGTAIKASAWRAVDGGPGPRYALQSIWDGHNKRLLVIAGETNVVENDKLTGFVMHEDVWAFDPEKETWTALPIKGDKPSKRAFYGACYDPDRRGVWLHGGFDGKRMLDDLWFFDYVKDVWSKVQAKGPTPPIRDLHSLVYNAKAGQLLVFGGLRDLGTMDVLDDQWTFDVRTSAWSPVAAKGNRPSARFGQTTAWDEQGQRLFVQGGIGAGGQPASSALWIYDVASETWTSRRDPGARNFATGQMVYLPDTDRLLIFGGGGNNIEYWCDLADRRWLSADGPAPMEGRSFHAMALDPATNRLFVFGGVRRMFTDPCVAGKLWVAEPK